ncbi:NYN domain-containing protein [Sphingopyxis witflariensis]|uniref:NYN domain-containing protein n=1 Tax=Sphingopyxis witflariensis TaxID=173675 RepID=UPI0013034E03|nr:NYN domain-containing protein [Sphingopyxis witflariensis]
MPTKTALLIDFDNVFISLWDLDRDAALRFASDPSDWLQVLANTHLNGEPRRWLVARCYLNPAGFVYAAADRKERVYFSRFRPGLVRAGFEVIDCPAVTRQGKNAADIRIVLDVLDLLAHHTRFDEFVIASGDADFTPLLQRIRAEDRRIAIMSPSYLASAYTALADRIVDFDALVSILNGEAEETTPDAFDSGSKQIAPVGQEQDEETRFADFIRRRYDEASGPLSLAALAVEAARICPSAKRSNWFGRKTFSAAVVGLKLQHLRTSNHHLWDDERHQPPVAASDVQVANVPETVALFMRALDFPRIEQKDWPILFRSLSSYATDNTFNFTEATRWTRDEMAERHGAKVARGSVAYVVRGCQFGGARLDAEIAPSADQIGNAFYNALLDRAASLGIQVSPESEVSIADWLGLEPLNEGS